MRCNLLFVKHLILPFNQKKLFLMQFIILISFLFPTPNSLVYSEFCAQRAHLHTTNCHHSYIFYYLVIIPSPTYIGFNSNPNRTNGLISPHGLPPQKHTLTTKQPKNSGNHHHHGHLCPPLPGGFNFKGK